MDSWREERPSLGWHFPGGGEKTPGMESPEPAGRMSMGARLLNVVLAPGEVFEALSRAPFSVANWLVPAALVALVGILCQTIVFSQPAMVQQVQEIQARELQRQVDSGKIKAADAEKAKQVMEGLGMTIVRVAGAFGVVVVAVVGPLGWGLLAWLVGRWVFRSPMGYLKALEVAGLTAMIGVLGMVVGTFLAIGLGNLFGGAHAGLLVKDFDLGNRSHLALAALNVFSLWHLAVLAVGTSKVSGRPWVPVLAVLGGLWVGYKAIAVALKLSQFVL